MFHLTVFELQKIWKKKIMLAAAASLLLINLFLLWYINASQGDNPSLFSYRQFQNDIIHMSEQEKEEYIQTLYDDIQGIIVVNDIVNCQKMTDGSGEQMAKQLMQDHEGVFEKYHRSFQSGDYLKYTDSLAKETAFINEIYEEAQKVFHYSSYKKEIEAKKAVLNQVAIFSKDDQTFSGRNIIKEAADYAKINPDSLIFFPAKGIMGTTQNTITDVLMMLIVILFSCHLVFDEKEKRLFYVTKATQYGGRSYIGAKVIALWIHCAATSLCFTLSNCLFYFMTSGVASLFCDIQSLAPFVESTLPITVLAYLLFSLIIKAIVMFVIGLIVVYVSLKAKHTFTPYLMIGGIIWVQALGYMMIPAQSNFNWLKYMNLFGFLNSHDLLGSYLNMNFMGYPVSRLSFSILILGIFVMSGILCSLYAFQHMKNFEISRMKPIRFFQWKPHSHLLYHELYKMMITNKALVVLIVFVFFMGYWHCNQKVSLSSNEYYYQNMMMELEGELTPAKETVIQQEKKRFDSAFAQMKQIDAMQEEGKMDEKTAEAMKMNLYSETYFYPSFMRIYDQYQYVKAHEGTFVYETGYALLSGIYDNNKIMDYILIAVCAVLMFHSMFAWEYQNKSWQLLSATQKGKSAITKNKLLITAISIGIVSITSFVMKYVALIQTCPMDQMLASTSSLPFFQANAIDVPIIIWLLSMVFIELLVSFAIAIIVLVLSERLKQQLNTIFCAGFVLVIPLILYAMGLSSFQWLSFFPLFNQTVEFALTQSYLWGSFYIALAAAVIVTGMRYLLREGR